ncbi:hypothetical protein CcrC1_gp332 [Caulobacter phage C1]|nr:hypothetical protein CcrC1_gp332 [Caulobacter phage C1]UTU08561.1 hypothetical protein CcrC2_gp333 [Caulobacter phage C2]UTU09077.1 hypothetical protein CcrJ4_gp328 [Caulobacter phage J4]UTU09636.1 hypothetical protein CcrBL47_gp350 [Caulobacter phage BL47]UTU10194.1 hypothetical protein CcrRB23_gp332 [Caulobacter phage RB23]WGN97228.1 hypothetical protein [Bertelyvirus sp.]
MYLLNDVKDQKGSTTVLLVKEKTFDHVVGYHVSADGTVSEQTYGARRVNWIAFFDTFEEVKAARKAAMEAFKAHDKAMEKARKVLRDATNDRKSAWTNAILASPGAQPVKAGL